MTDRTQLDPPLFLVGYPRSGTTLLQAMLAAHPLIASVPETHFFAKLVSKQRRLRRLGLTDRRQEAWGYLMAKQPGFLGKETVSRTPFVRAHAKLFQRRLDAMAAASGARLWLEKTPRHLHHIAQIEHYLHGVRFIHILRSGADAIASLVDVTRRHPESWGGRQPFDKLTRRWLDDVAISLDQTGRSNHHLCLYEDLIDDPERVLRGITGFLGLAFAPSMISNHGSTYAEIGETNAVWTRAAAAPVRRPARKFETLLDDAEKDQIEASLRAAGLWAPDALKARLRAASS